MKYAINAILTTLAALLLVAFAFLIVSPTVTEEAFQEHLNGGSALSQPEEDASEDDFDFLEDMGGDDDFSFLEDMDGMDGTEEDGEEEDPFAFLDDFDAMDEDTDTDEEEDPFAFLDDF